MQIRKALVCGALLIGLFTPFRASAEQRQDWLLAGAGEPGTYVNLDAIFGAFQASLEHRWKLYAGTSNTFLVRGSAIAAIPFGGAQLDADLRLLILTIGTSVGGVDAWRGMQFAPGEPVNRRVRREREAGGAMSDIRWGFWEGRANLVFPFNDYVLLNVTNSYRLADMPSRTYDNLINVVHDGEYVKNDFQLFLKHRDLGSIAPVVQLLHFHFDGKLRHQLNYGFIILTRAGLVRRDDFLYFQMMFHSGDTFGGYNNSDNYGQALLRAPASFTLLYRCTINL